MPGFHAFSYYVSGQAYINSYLAKYVRVSCLGFVLMRHVEALLQVWCPVRMKRVFCYKAWHGLTLWLQHAAGIVQVCILRSQRMSSMHARTAVRGELSSCRVGRQSNGNVPPCLGQGVNLSYYGGVETDTRAVRYFLADVNRKT
jgi:hypothetical protein